jgi:hypothetical protein
MIPRWYPGHGEFPALMNHGSGMMVIVHPASGVLPVGHVSIPVRDRMDNKLLNYHTSKQIQRC